MKNTKVSLMARIYLIEYFLQEQAYAEIMLVRLQYLHDVYMRVIRSPSSVVLHYHGTSLSMLHQKLERPGSASDEATISIIVANLTLNQQFEDWEQFQRIYIWAYSCRWPSWWPWCSEKARSSDSHSRTRALCHVSASHEVCHTSERKGLRLIFHTATSGVPAPSRLSCEVVSTIPLENGSRRRITSSYDVTLPLKVLCRSSFFVDSSKCSDNKGA